MVIHNDFQKAVELLGRAGNVLITTHIRPDGDACGSMVALREALCAQGKQVSPLLISPLPQWYEFLFAEKVPVLGNDVTVEDLKAGCYNHCDLVIVVDTNSNAQLPGFEEYLKAADLPVLIFDHHITADGLGTVELVDSRAAATGQIIYDFFGYAGWQVTEKIAEALFVAISTDTGWFRFSNTDSRTLRTAAELLEAGADPTAIYRRMYQSFSPARVRLMAEMLDTLQLHLDGRVATQYILRRDFERIGATGADTENLIDECQRIASVEVAALFVELKDGRFRCSLRSKGDMDVSTIARQYGGGGHRMAAGCHVPGPAAAAVKLIVGRLKGQLEAGSV